MDISIGVAIGYAVMGLAVVFFGLLLLFVVITIMGKISSSGKKSESNSAPAAVSAAPAAVSAAPKETAPGSAGEIMIHDVPEKEAAMIMAIVADKMQTPLNELRFKSIREVK